MSSSKYLISRFGDPVFALFIGCSAAWLRIRREEVERFHASRAMTGETTTSKDSSSMDYDTSDSSMKPPQSTSTGSDGPPTNLQTYNLLLSRLSRVDPREWNWRGALETRQRNTWGIVDGPER